MEYPRNSTPRCVCNRTESTGSPETPVTADNSCSHQSAVINYGHTTWLIQILKNYPATEGGTLNTLCSITEARHKSPHIWFHYPQQVVALSGKQIGAYLELDKWRERRGRKEQGFSLGDEGCLESVMMVVCFMKMLEPSKVYF